MVVMVMQFVFSPGWWLFFSFVLRSQGLHLPYLRSGVWCEMQWSKQSWQGKTYCLIWTLDTWEWYQTSPGKCTCCVWIQQKLHLEWSEVAVLKGNLGHLACFTRQKSRKKGVGKGWKRNGWGRSLAGSITLGFLVKMEKWFKMERPYSLSYVYCMYYYIYGHVCTTGIYIFVPKCPKHTCHLLSKNFYLRSFKALDFHCQRKLDLIFAPKALVVIWHTSFQSLGVMTHNCLTGWECRDW